MSIIELFDILYEMTIKQMIILALIENLVIIFFCLVAGEFIVRYFRSYSISDAHAPISTEEIVLTFSTLIINSLITIIGIILWQNNHIKVDFNIDILVILIDFMVLFIVMDLFMYIFHRLAHLPLLFPIVHKTHHKYVNVRPLTLFVLNPFEALGFGVLWLVILVIYPANWISIVIYLTINIIFGFIGHTGIEALPETYIKIPVINYISTSTFHNTHHQNKNYNFGFYTLIWDKVFGTISPEYYHDFLKLRKK